MRFHKAFHLSRLVHRVTIDDQKYLSLKLRDKPLHEIDKLGLRLPDPLTAISGILLSADGRDQVQSKNELRCC